MPTPEPVSACPLPKVTLLRGGNWMVIDPTTPQIHDLIAPQLTFFEKEFLRGRERTLAIKNELPTVNIIPRQVFATDGKGRLSCPYGYAARVRRTLRQNGYEVATRNLDLEKPGEQERRAQVFVPRWDRLQTGRPVTFRHRQDEGVAKIISAVLRSEPGKVDCPTGWGKSYTVGIIARVLPKLKILFVTKSVTVLRTRIYPELCLSLPGVGICCGKEKVMNKRVMCVSTDSLHHVVNDHWDLIVVDEAHQAASDAAAGKLVQFPGQPVLIGLSASFESRIDGKDFREEALFGNYLMRIPYQEAVEHGLIVPIEVHWRELVLDVDPIDGVINDTARKRWGIWQNGPRNDLILEDSMVDQPQQTMVFCEKIEHLLALHKKDPSLPILCRPDSLDYDRVKDLKKHNLPVEKVLDLTEAKLQALTRQAMDGTLKRFAVNTLFNVGVDMPDLVTLVRADGMGSPTADTQIPGRTSRLGIVPGKTTGRIRDYLDCWNRGFYKTGMIRAEDYARHQWPQYLPNAKAAEQVRKMYLKD